MDTPPIRQRFLKVGDRRVRYLRAGSGTPVVLIHSSPAHAGNLAPLMNRLSPRHTVYVFDNPGFGSSDPLTLDKIVIADLADALAEAMRAMRFPAVPVFGTHTGAAIGVELGVRHPDLVSGLILDGVPIFTREEVQGRIDDGYFFPLEAHPLGGHFANTWTRFRDQMTYHPWCTKIPANAHVSGIYATAENTHEWVSMFFRSARTFEKPYMAAHFFGDVAAERMTQLEKPTVITAAASDSLSKQFPRFPRLRPNQNIVPLGNDPNEKKALLEQLIAKWDSKAPAPADLPAPADSAGIDKRFVDLPSGQVFVRSCGLASNPPLIVLHDAPGSSHGLEAELPILALAHKVYAVDMPGCGESDPLPGDAPDMADYAKALADVCAQLGVTKVAVYGAGFGASVAAALAQASPDLVSHVIVRGALLPDDEARADMRANYAPPIAIEADGAHWYRTWLMLRDSLTYWPWYKRGAAAVRLVPADFGADRLHDWTVQVMNQHHGYHHVINAALDHNLGATLSALRQPVLIVADPLHPFWPYQDRLTALLPGAATIAPVDSYQDAAEIRDFAEITGSRVSCPKIGQSVRL